MQPDISIIVPVYNKAAYLSECLESLQAQTYQNIEVILIDDGSTDESPLICQNICERDSHFRYFRQQNGGQNAARKTGVEMARGEWVLFVDADDYVSTKMCAIFRKRQRETHADMVYGCIQKIPGKNGENAYHGWKGVLNGKTILRTILPIGSTQKGEQQGISGLGGGLFPILMKKERVSDALQHMDLRIRYSEDLGCVFYILLRAKRVAFVSEIVYYYRQTPGSALHAQARSCLLSTKWLQVFLEQQFYEQGMLASDMQIVQQALIRTLLCGGYEFFDDYPGIYPFFQGARGRRLAVYGAGVVGKELEEKLSGFEFVGWFDRDFERYQELGLDVRSPEGIASTEFDIMVVAIQHPEIAEVVCKSIAGRLPQGAKIYAFSEKILHSAYTEHKLEELRDIAEDYVYHPH